MESNTGFDMTMENSAAEPLENTRATEPGAGEQPISAPGDKAVEGEKAEEKHRIKYNGEIKELTLDELKTLVLILCPFAPHLAEELWERLGGEGLCSAASWPEWDEAKCEDKTVEIAVQILGKLKGTVTVDVDADRDSVLALVKSDARFTPFIEGKQIVKEIYVPGKIVNLVVK